MSSLCPIARAAQRAPERVAIVFESERIRYEELEERIQRLAVALRTRGVQEGARVAIRAHNHPDMVALFFALPRLGASLVPLNLRWTQRELDAALAQVQPQCLLTPEELRALHVASHKEPSRAREPLQHRVGNHPVALLFTSGTSGVPKVAPLHASQLEAASQASAARILGSETDCWLGTLPLFHVGGLVMVYRSAWAAGRLVLEPGFDAERVWGLLAREEITHASLVATTLRRLLESGGSRRAPTSLRAVLVGGGPVPRSLWQSARAMGFPALLTYGLTEAGSQVCTEQPGSADGRTVGPPLPGVQLQIVDENGVLKPIGEVGEIELRGPTVMRAYWGTSGESAKVFRDGWFRTGDLGRVDAQGRLAVDARRTDLILSGGENVYPAEIEAVLLEHPFVSDAVVVPHPSEEWGQMPVAFFVPSNIVDDATLDAWCRKRLGSFKVPKKFIRLSELPRNAAGKIDRGALSRANVRAEKYVDEVSQVLERGERMELGSDVMKYLGEVERSLSAALADEPGELAHGSETLGAAARHLTLGSGGKRVRPVLAHLFGRVCGVPEASVVTVGVSAELVHTASLLHDDVVDQGMFRRSRPTVNALWGNNVAVMAGDMLLTLAIQQLESMDRRVTSAAVRTVQEMTRATIAEVEGRGDLTLAVDRFRAICEGKTGALFGYCGSAVGVLANDPEAIERLSNFGRHLGVAFQFADDVLDLTGRDPGKPQFADLRSRTPAFAVALGGVEERCNSSDDPRPMGFRLDAGCARARSGRSHSGRGRGRGRRGTGAARSRRRRGCAGHLCEAPRRRPVACVGP